MTLKPSYLPRPSTPREVATMDAALIEVLQAAKLHNEEGEMLTDFVNQDRDALDFASVSRQTLLQMLSAAYRAGKYSR